MLLELFICYVLLISTLLAILVPIFGPIIAPGIFLGGL